MGSTESSLSLDLELQRELIVACQDGNIDEISRLAKLPETNINDPGNCFNTPLITAILKGHLTVVKLLHGLGVNIHDNTNQSPLYWAVNRHHIEIVKFLLEKGVNPSMVIDGTPMINYAAGWGHNKIVGLLLEKGADPNQLDKEGRTALHCAAAVSSARNLNYVTSPIDTLELLLNQPKIRFIQDNQGNLPLHYFVQGRNISLCVKTLNVSNEEEDSKAIFDRIFFVYYKLFHASSRPFIKNKNKKLFSDLMGIELKEILQDIQKREHMSVQLAAVRDKVADFIIKNKWNKPEIPSTPGNRKIVPGWMIEQVFFNTSIISTAEFSSSELMEAGNKAIESGKPDKEVVILCKQLRTQLYLLPKVRAGYFAGQHSRPMRPIAEGINILQETGQYTPLRKALATVSEKNGLPTEMKAYYKRLNKLHI